jgi:hypothetical protein
MFTENCPYCENEKYTDFQYAKKHAEEDKHSGIWLEWCHDLKCDNWFLVIKGGAHAGVIASIKRPEDWKHTSPQKF